MRMNYTSLRPARRNCRKVSAAIVKATSEDDNRHKVPHFCTFSVMEGGSFALFREEEISPEKSIRKQCYWSVTAAGSEWLILPVAQLVPGALALFCAEQIFSVGEIYGNIEAISCRITWGALAKVWRTASHDRMKGRFHSNSWALVIRLLFIKLVIQDYIIQRRRHAVAEVLNWYKLSWCCCL